MMSVDSPSLRSARRLRDCDQSWEAGYSQTGAIMKSGRFFSSLMLAGVCLWTLNTTAAESHSIESRVAAQDGEADQRELSALNTLGIRYAKGSQKKSRNGDEVLFALCDAMLHAGDGQYGHAL
jgi:hypothetical protein